MVEMSTIATAAPATNEVEETAEPPSGWLQIAAPSSATKRKYRPAGTPDPDAEVVSLSPRTLLEPKTYVCEICNRGFRRATNLQMHRRRHGVPWEQLQKREAGKAAPPARKRVFVCPEPSCPHHHPSRALSGASAIKHHFRRQHSAHRQWSCSRCSRAFAVHGDYKAHLKTCGGSRTRARVLRYPCHCGRVFFRVDTFAYHQQRCRAVPRQADVPSAPVCSALSEPQKPATSLSLSGFASPTSGILIGAVIWQGTAAMRSPTVPTLGGFLPPPDTSRSGHDLELQLMPPSCHAAPRSPPAPISRGDAAAIQLQLTIGLCSSDSRGGGGVQAVVPSGATWSSPVAACLPRPGRSRSSCGRRCRRRRGCSHVLSIVADPLILDGIRRRQQLPAMGHAWLAILDCLLVVAASVCLLINRAA